MIFFCHLIEATTPAPVQPGPGGRVELRVVVSPEILQVQYGQTYEITCGVFGADASTTIYWIQEEPERVKEFLSFDLKLNIPSFLAICSD
jgi:hypothetical protein